jgi:hypothetical protein
MEEALPRAAAKTQDGRMRASLVVLAAGLLGLASGLWTASARSDADSPPLSEADRKATTQAVQLFLTLSAHLRAADGDPRYAERLPAVPEVVDELMGDVQFLRRSHRVEVPKLVKVEILGLRRAGFELATVRTKEFWITRETTGEQSPRSDVVFATYQLRREPGGWRVASWEIEAADPGPIAASVGR